MSVGGQELPAWGSLGELGVGGRSGQGEQSSGGREGRSFSQAAFLAGSLETRERPGKVSAGAGCSQNQRKVGCWV